TDNRRKLMHELIVHFQRIAPTWLLLDLDWSATKRAAPFLRARDTGGISMTDTDATTDTGPGPESVDPFEIISTPWGNIERWRASTLSNGSMGLLAQVP